MAKTSNKTYVVVGGNAHGSTFSSDNKTDEIVMSGSRYNLKTYSYRKGNEIRQWKLFACQPVHWRDVNQALLDTGLFDDCEKQIVSDEFIKIQL